MSFSICCGLPEGMSMSIYATAMSFVFNIVPGISPMSILGYLYLEMIAYNQVE